MNCEITANKIKTVGCKIVMVMAWSISFYAVPKKEEIRPYLENIDKMEKDKLDKCIIA